MSRSQQIWSGLECHSSRPGSPISPDPGPNLSARAAELAAPRAAHPRAPHLELLHVVQVPERAYDADDVVDVVRREEQVEAQRETALR